MRGLPSRGAAGWSEPRGAAGARAGPRVPARGLAGAAVGGRPRRPRTGHPDREGGGQQRRREPGEQRKEPGQRVEGVGGGGQAGAGGARPPTCGEAHPGDGPPLPQEVPGRLHDRQPRGRGQLGQGRGDVQPRGGARPGRVHRESGRPAAGARGALARRLAEAGSGEDRPRQGGCRVAAGCPGVFASSSRCRRGGRGAACRGPRGERAD
mmetsp:Transcript_17945/g.50594  ORF Transcript_17945/g.50594 Transcript_17945/m.50594 type:complete len:209 (-) Transcript_17945:956-1582(-)